MHRLRSILPCLLSCLAAFELAACVQQIGTGDDTTSGSTASSATASGDDGGGGTNCGEDPTTQITLCSSLNECPTIAVDPSALAGCGFRVHPNSTVIDLECVCGDYLCPIGVPDTCAQAATLLNGLTSLVVCEEASEGKCVQEAAPEAGTTSTTTTGTSGTTGTSSTCITGCITSCGTAPDCLQLCGC
jgi:hypothetical protein